MLDLGVFMALQSLVGNKICGKVVDKNILSEVIVELFQALNLMFLGRFVSNGSKFYT